MCEPHPLFYTERVGSPVGPAGGLTSGFFPLLYALQNHGGFVKHGIAGENQCRTDAVPVGCVVVAVVAVGEDVTSPTS